MQAGQPSVTARLGALHRALHQIVDSPRALEDPFALPIVVPVSEKELAGALRSRTAMRAAIVLGSRHAEDCLAAAVESGVRQYVVLGAGFDTYALRNPFQSKGLAVFEVDHPATQAWKRQRLADARLVPAKGTTFVSVDFETQSLRQRLEESGLRFDRPAFFSLLGVTIYLTREATMETLGMVAGCAAGSEIVFSFSVPAASLTPAQQERREQSVARMARLGEPWITFFDPKELAGELRGRGFRETAVLTPEEANRRYFSGRRDGLRVSTGHLMSART